MVPVGSQRGPLPGELRGGNRLVITSGGQVREVGEVQQPLGPAEGPCTPPWSALSRRAGAGDPGKVPAVTKGRFPLVTVELTLARADPAERGRPGDPQGLATGREAPCS
uniref:Uncharacterized protein n=1 Tax=Rangifer tarandus platyrhynchus TaxID=3082113 RepID=A0ACB0FP74_RANTA|nr:unnamed protein product [Rangifer tarandus platyrhynchus]